MPNKYKIDVIDRCHVKKFRYDDVKQPQQQTGEERKRDRDADDHDENYVNIKNKERRIDLLQYHQSQQWLQQQIEIEQVKQQKEWDNFQNIIQFQQTQINEYQILIEKLKQDKLATENKLQQTILEQFKTISINTETINYLNCQRTQLQDTERLKRQEIEHYKQLQQQQKSEFIEKYNHLYQENLNLKQDMLTMNETNKDKSKIIDSLNQELLKKDEIENQLLFKIQQFTDNSNFNKNIQLEKERLKAEKEEKENQENIIRIEKERIKQAEKEEKERLERLRVEKELEILNIIKSSKKPEQIFQLHLNINIKTTYRNYSKFIHPDKCGSTNDPEIFQKLKEAYDILNGVLSPSESSYFNFN